MNALLPFYGLPIATLAERAAEAEDIVETFTLIVTDGKVELQWNDEYSRDTWWASRPRADSQINLMEPFLNLLPDLRCVDNFGYTAHAGPGAGGEGEREGAEGGWGASSSEGDIACVPEKPGTAFYALP